MQETKLIFGAPGCGKTTYLLNILEQELRELKDPGKIAFVSFTRKGAYEAKERAVKEFKYKEADLKYFRTIHSMCFQELKMSKYSMLTYKDYRLFSKAVGKNFVGYYTEDFYHNDDMYLFLYFLKQNNYTMYQEVRDALEPNIETLKHIAHNYNRFKEQFRKYDFTDLLQMTLRQKLFVPVEVAIIDEAQDLTTLQWKVCEQLFVTAKRVYIAGDDDQAIYEWTGADVKYFLNIPGERTILDKSWRLQSNLLDFAKKISANINLRVDKDFKPVAEGGAVEFYNDIAEIDFNDEETWYCLSRNNAFLPKYSTVLKDKLKQFIVKDKPSVRQEVLFAINNFDAFKNGTLKDTDNIKVQKLLRKDIKSAYNLSWFEALNIDAEDLLYYRQLIQNRIIITEPNIMVNTIHGVKGGEADNVVLLMDITKNVFRQLYKLKDSEFRCLYVACTRAKKKLHIVFPKTKHSYADFFKELTYEHNI